MDAFFAKIIRQANISSECKHQLQMLQNGLLQKEMWALKMMDAYGLHSPGSLEGNYVNLGSFDECLGINVYVGSKKFQGKYCLLDMYRTDNNTGITRTVPRVRAICVPKTCSKTDIRELCFNNYALSTECQTSDDVLEFDVKAIVALCLFGCIGLILLVATVLDYYLYYYQKETSKSWLLSFSVLTNVKRLFTVTESSNDITCLNGIRVMAMTWTAYAHFNLLILRLPATNLQDAFEFIMSSHSGYLTSSSVNVDTFLVLSAVLISYGFLSSKFKLNLFTYYSVRYIRLTPTIAVLMLFQVCLLKYVSFGPVWLETVGLLTNNCPSEWWKNLLYVQNYNELWNMCVPEGWYLAVDMQLYLLSPILLLGLRKMPKVALSGMGVLIILSAVTCFGLSWIFNMQMSGVYPYPAMSLYYTATHSRASSWLIGFILGYIMYKHSVEKNRPNIPHWAALATWAVSISVLITCIFAGNEHRLDNDKLSNAFYTLRRPAWSLGVCWMLYSCHFGFGGVINNILSANIFRILSRLMYSLYLVHILMGIILYGNIKVSVHLEEKDMFQSFWGFYVFSLLAALIMTVAIESPIQALTKYFFKKREPKPDDA
ncbi:hypothetical protein PPYR_06696 [Photinus pyralis]|uniref:Nose resistant-to-fluoxetine protein N-terminal domain-containing protein n=2 Tax=Photinus pyralis TaxID=7054 RepID=A0A5N4AND4_PHOPY|nr:hypothetical protein PPYR_06696 [Photinus pyralis]